ncbi:MAG: 23S rRNA (pseudouridine(1915)-N(3))-methyltransferase RlmH [Gammaproteobacteria bacterium]|nr:23S rRNA (pseudouridine(1915)-N(3))-methyltransferase RlmH [Gammaproteobacteria bacterium]
MQLTLFAVGRRASGWLREATADYAGRFPPELKLTIREIAPARRAASEPKPSVLRAEAKAILKAIPGNALVVALDERGRQQNTAGLARELAEWMETGRSVALVIGGADGLDASVIDGADAVWSLSSLTLPHGLVRVLLLEQLYRAWTILKGHPYHRE